MSKFVWSVILFTIVSLTNSQAQTWKQYPYHQSGSALYFPADEGNHPASETEWWYLNAHLLGANTGAVYHVMLTFFYRSNLAPLGYRILNIGKNSSNEFYSNFSQCVYTTLATNHLNILTNTTGVGVEKWATKRNAQNNLIPFEYEISAASPFGSINFNCAATKRPLMVGETGFFNQGANGSTHYYSLTTMSINGMLTLNGVTEPVSGVAWMDHQYGNLQSTVQETYEWFSIHLSNGMDLNLWSIFTNQNQIPDTSTYKLCSVYINDQSDTTFHDFDFRRLQYAFVPSSGNCYAKKWRLIRGNIDLTLTAVQSNCEVTSPYYFYEGNITVEGTVNGVVVNGIGFAELLHSYKKPKVDFATVAKLESTSNLFQVKWKVLNPDDGCPLRFDLGISNNGGSTFTSIARGLLDTAFTWDTTGYGVRSNSILKVTAYSIDSTLSGFDTIRVNQIVPVELISFNAIQNALAVNITWTTATEINNYGFEIEKSADGAVFYKIGFVDGRGTTSEKQDYLFVDHRIELDKKLYYRLKQIDFSGDYKYSDVIEVMQIEIPAYIELSQNYPNPFNPSTKIRYTIPNSSDESNKKQKVVLRVFNTLGSLVATLVNEEQVPGIYELEFSIGNGTETNPTKLASGILFYQLIVGEYVQTKSMLLLK